jgi:hypothetical protein
VGASFYFRFLPHDFVGVVPFLGLVIGYGLTEALEVKEPRSAPQVAGALVFLGGLILFVVLGNLTVYRNMHHVRDLGAAFQNPQRDPIVRYVEERTNPWDTIFVWGYRPEIYVSSGRYPASRYVFAGYPSGVIPWFYATRAEDEGRVVPGSREQLVRDLEESRPELIIDAGRTLAGRYMFDIPPLRTYLDAHYCFMRNVDGEPIYRRRRGQYCPVPAAVQ